MLIEFAINECSVDHLWALEKIKEQSHFILKMVSDCRGKDNLKKIQRSI